MINCRAKAMKYKVINIKAEKSIPKKYTDNRYIIIGKLVKKVTEYKYKNLSSD
tara:strand:- start:129 stop:287 length:159 start_codon:yes stop_codon:yes gene_type:complete